MTTPPPPIAGPPYDDIAGRAERLAQDLSEWKPPPDGQPELGRTLIRLFDRMARQVITRLNQVPDRSFLAFLNLLGVDRAPARPARVPLTFTLVERGSAEPTIPAGSRVGAAPAPGDTRDVLFETERELATTRARLVGAFTRQPDGDRWADHTEAATGKTPGFYDPFSGTQPVEHAFFIAIDEGLQLPPKTAVTVAVSFPNPEDINTWHALHDLDQPALPALASDPYYKTLSVAAPLMRWSYWNGSQWKEFVPSGTFDAQAKTWRFGFTLLEQMQARNLGGHEARWLRATLAAWPAKLVPTLAKLEVSATVKTTPDAPDAALFNGRPLDLSMDFYPLGERPRLNDTFYVASAKALSRPSATVTVTLVKSSQQLYLKLDDSPKLAWEVSTTSGWQKVAETTPSAPLPNQPSKVNDVLSKATFTLPANVAPMEVQGKRAHWLRIRLVSGDFGKGVQVNNGTVTDDGYRPPLLEFLRLESTAQVGPFSPTSLSARDFTLITHPKQWLVPFLRTQNPPRALYLGFDRPFPPRDMMLYLQVGRPSLEELAHLGEAPASAPPKVVWEYSTAGSWQPLGTEDETQGLAQSGMVRFIGPAPFAPRTEFGQTLYWLRLRLEEGAFPLTPRLGRVLTNTVWASHTTTLTGEVLGSSDGGPSQKFTLSQRPVLAGQRIEVREAEERWVDWQQVPDFSASGPGARHYTLDSQTGEVRFGNGQHGMVPPRGARNIRAAVYQTGGGVEGNRPVGTVSELKTAIAYVDGVTNLEAASGGADRESAARATARGPRMLRHRGRAVTAEDFADLAYEASPAVARVKVLTARFNPSELIEQPNLPFQNQQQPPVVVLLVPSSPELPPVPSVGLLRDVETYLQQRCAPAVRLRVAGPDWLTVSTTLKLIRTPTESTEALRGRVERALREFLHPLTGGFDGTGWDFGQLPRASDLYRLLSALPGVDTISTLTLTIPPVEPARAARALIYPGTQTLTIQSQ
jgi:hypothetical protein